MKLKTDGGVLVGASKMKVRVDMHELQKLVHTNGHKKAEK